MTRGDDTAVLILAGGRSSRFGSDKAAALVDGVPSIDRVHEAVRAVGPVWVSGPSRQMARAVAGFLPDEQRDQGPLHALICCFSKIRASRLLVVCCDQPWLTPAAIEALVAPLSDGALARIPVVRGHRLVLTALYDGAARRVFEDAWGRGVQSPTRALLDSPVEELSEEMILATGFSGTVFDDFDAPQDLPWADPDHKP